MFFLIPSQPMDHKEESNILLSTGCPPPLVEILLSFAEKYRQSISVDNTLKNRTLGTRSLVRIARRLAMFPQDDDLNSIISRSLLAEFLPASEQMNLDALLEEVDIEKKTPPVRLSSIACVTSNSHGCQFNLNPVVEGSCLTFPSSNSTGDSSAKITIACFDPSQDMEGVASHVPHMDHFYDNSLQTGLMRDLAIDLELLGEHVVLLGNQVWNLRFI